MSSFQRQLNLYGFVRITSGPDEGGYYHELFLRGRPKLCSYMRRVGVPTILPNGQIVSRRTQRKAKAVMEMAPDFYNMKKITIPDKQDKMPPLKKQGQDESDEEGSQKKASKTSGDTTEEDTDRGDEESATEISG